MSAASYQQGQQAAVDITPGFFPLLWVFYFCTPQYSVDGGPPQRGRWGSNLLSVAPGRHQISVWVPYLFFSTCGRNTIVIDVNPGTTTKVAWNTPWLVFLQGSIRVAGVFGLPAGGAPPAMASAQGQPAQPPATAGGWFPDPSGRYQQRYYDGRSWTAHVTANGQTFEDQLPA